MALSRTSDHTIKQEAIDQPCWWMPNGTAIEGPVEWQPCYLSLPCKLDHVATVTVTVNGAPLAMVVRRIGQDLAVVAEWPRQGPGHYHIVAVWGDCRWTATIAILPSKLSSGEFHELIDDLERRLPTLVALGIQRSGGLAGVSLSRSEHDTLAQEYERLQRAIAGHGSQPGLETILQRLATRYREQLRAPYQWRPRTRARRVTPVGLSAAIRQPNNIDSDRRLVDIFEPVVEHHPDIYENQVVKLFLHVVRDRLRRLSQHVDRKPTSELAPRLEGLTRRLTKAASSAGFLEDVTLPSTPPRRVTMILMRVPEYRAAFQGLIELQRNAVVRLDQPQSESPLSNLPALYQTWCTLNVIVHVLNIATSQGFELVAQRVIHRRHADMFVRVLRDGSVAVSMRHPASGTSLKVIPERTYGRVGHLHSISFEQRPDIAIEIRTPGHKPHVLLLDPKYKLESDDLGGDGTPCKVDIDKMHAYRDAIRGTDDQHVVAFAATLYPGQSQSYGDGLAAMLMKPGSADLSALPLARELTSAIAQSRL